MNEVTAEVVEVPKPVRPELWAVVYEGGPRDSRAWYSDVLETEEAALASAEARRSKYPSAIAVHIPGSASPPAVDARLCPDCKTEPRLFNRPYCRSCEGKHEAAAKDAIVELCADDHHIVTRRADRTTWCVERYDKWGEESACAYGPSPQSAARACLEAIRKAGG